MRLLTREPLGWHAKVANINSLGAYYPKAMMYTRRKPKAIRTPQHTATLWCVVDRRITSAAAARDAIRVAEQIRSHEESGPTADETVLFSALHAAAHQTNRATKQRRFAEARRWHRRWHRLREHLVNSNLGLVHLMIKRYRARELDEDDLLSDGLYGLGRAVEKFNPLKGYRFSTYACNVIARSLMRRVKLQASYRRRFPVHQEESYERPTRPADSDVELRVERLQRVLDCNLGELTDLESQILSRRFPDDGPRLTYAEIGQVVGLSKERVRQIQNIALGKLKEVLLEDPILQ